MECIRTYFAVDRKDIRCTSVRPYRLPVGENTADRLRDEITEAEVVLGILTTDTLESSYVAFELGSAWGQRVWTLSVFGSWSRSESYSRPHPRPFALIFV